LDEARALIDAKKKFPPALGVALLDHFLELGVGCGEQLIAERVRTALYQKRGRLEKSLATAKNPEKAREELAVVDDDIAGMTRALSASRRPDSVRRAFQARVAFDRELAVISGALHRAHGAFRDLEQAHADELEHTAELAADTQPRWDRAPRAQAPRRR
jgi:hypothetical protein